MADLKRQVDDALAGTEKLPRDLVISWIDGAQDLETLSKLYRLTDEGYSRIHPYLGADKTCALIQRYLLECIKQDVKDREEIMDRWEAARTLHAWFCELSEKEETPTALTKAARAVTDLFLVSGEEVRDAIEQGFLEHALEMEAIRPFFEYWSRDERLQETWARALEWGKAHPGFPWGLVQQLRKIQEGS